MTDLETITAILKKRKIPFKKIVIAKAEIQMDNNYSYYSPGTYLDFRDQDPRGIETLYLSFSPSGDLRNVGCDLMITD